MQTNLLYLYLNSFLCILPMFNICNTSMLSINIYTKYIYQYTYLNMTLGLLVYQMHFVCISCKTWYMEGEALFSNYYQTCRNPYFKTNLKPQRSEGLSQFFSANQNSLSLASIGCWHNSPPGIVL